MKGITMKSLFLFVLFWIVSAGGLYSQYIKYLNPEYNNSRIIQIVSQRDSSGFFLTEKALYSFRGSSISFIRERARANEFFTGFSVSENYVFIIGGVGSDLRLYTQIVGYAGLNNVAAMPDPAINQASIYARNDDTLFLMTNLGVYRTTNAGSSWNRVSLNLARFMGFISSAVGYMATIDIVYKTTDGGLTWNQHHRLTTGIISKLVTAGSTAFVSKLSDSLVIIPAAGQPIIRRVSPEGVRDFAFANAQNGFAVDTELRTWQTNDGGNTWNPHYVQSVGLVALSDTAKVFGAGNSILFRFNSTENYWMPVDAIEFKPVSIISPHPSLILLGDNDGDIYRSTNNGTNFYRTAWSDGPLKKLVFESPQFIYALASSELSSGILRSQDSGKTFSHVFSTNGNLTDLVFVDISTLYAFGSNGDIYKTTDRWASYTVTPNSHGISISAAMFSDKMNGIISGVDAFNSAPRTYRTTNGGLSWSYAGNHHFRFFSFLEPYIGFAATNDSVFRTIDSGKTWQYAVSYENITGISILTPNSGYLFTAFSAIYFEISPFYFSIVYNPMDSVVGQVINNNLILAADNKSNIVYASRSNSHHLWGTFNIAGPGDTVDIPIGLVSHPQDPVFSAEFTASGYGSGIRFLSASTSGSILAGMNWMHSANAVGNTTRFAASGSTAARGDGLLVNLKYISQDSTVNVSFIDFTSVINTGTFPVQSGTSAVYQIPRRLGDVDLNGTVQAYDASLVLKHLVGGMDFMPVQAKNAQVTTDNLITSFDASVILRYITGIITSLPYSGTLNPAAGGLHLQAIQSLPGDTISFPVTLTGAANIFSIESTVMYDTAKLEYNSAVWNPAFSNFKTDQRNSNGKIYLAAASAEQFSAVSDFAPAILRFRLKPAFLPGSTSTLEVKNFRLNENINMPDAGSALLTVLTSLDDVTLPKEFRVHQNFPNPFNPSTQIRFELPAEEHVTLEVFDILGNKIRTLSHGRQKAGSHTVQFDAAGLSSGFYVYRVIAGSYSASKKMMILK